MTTATLEVRNLRTHFFTRAGVVKAVDDVSFSIARGQVLGLVGESGSGKTVTGFSIIGLVDPPGRIVGGSILYQGQDLAKLSEREMRALRGNRIAMIFQDPMMTLNPVLRIDTQMIETVLAHAKVSRAEARTRSRDALGMVGIPSPDERLHAYPHQFSGGMRQRVAIAIALLHHPDLLIADEPTTALDVTIQAQILAEVQKLATTYGTALIWITHDLSVIAGLADEIAVMYAGRIVETGDAEAVLDRPLHPYTHGLIGSVPSRNQRGEKLRQIPGMTPSLLSLPPGCAFRTRCAHADAACEQEPEPSQPAAGATITALLPSAGRSAGMNATPIIELRGVSKRFGPTYDAAARLARSVSRQLGGAHNGTRSCAPSITSISAVARGEVVGLVGESGCGKSTLGRMVAGIMPPTDGAVLFKGQDIATLAPDARARCEAEGADDLPGPLRLAQSAPARRGHRRRGAARRTASSRAATSTRISMRSFAAPASIPRYQAPLSAPVLRRPAPAHRHRPRARGAARIPGVRRGGRRARCVDPGADPQPVHGPAPRARPHLSCSSATISAWSSISPIAC